MFLLTSEQMKKSWYIFYFQIPGAVDKLAAATNYEWTLQSDYHLGQSRRLHACRTRRIPQSLYAARRFFSHGQLVSRDGSDEAGAADEFWSDYAHDFDVGRKRCRDASRTWPTKAWLTANRGNWLIIPKLSHWIQHEEADKVNTLIEIFARQNNLTIPSTGNSVRH